jgi:hypothetical protein
MSIFREIADRFSGDGPKEEKLKSAADQSSDEKTLAEFVKKRIEEVRSAGNRIAHEGTWMTNIAYLLGFDSVYYDTTNRQFRNVDGTGTVSLRRNRVFENLILPAVQNRQARLCKSDPKFEVRPEADTNEAKEEARLAHDVLLQLWDECQVNVKRLELTMWLQECGHSYLKVSFDDELGAELIDPTSEEFMGYEGKVVVEATSAFEVFPDPLAQDLDEAQWIIQAKVRKLDYFRTRYPERGHLVKEEGAWLLSVQYEQRIQSLNNTGMSSASSVLQMENAAIELSYYEKRSRKHRNGRHVIVANGVILKDTSLPFGEIPFAKFDDVMVAGKYYSEATITHARPLQDQYNRTLTRRAKWANTLLAGKYMAARGHGLMQEALDDQSGEVLEYDAVPGAPPPGPVPTPNIPNYAYEETKENRSSLNNIFGLSEVSQGKLPSASIPAVGMQLLLEQDETRIGIEVEQHEHSYARTGMLMLKCAAKNFKTPRKLKKRLANGDMNVKEYEGKDLPTSPDIRVVRGSTVPTSLSMKRQDILNIMQLGLLGNPQDPQVQEKILEMLEFGNTQGLWQDSALVSAQAKREIDHIEMGQMPDINMFDNHPVILKKLNNFRISDKGVQLDPEKKDLLEQVIQLHAKYQTDLTNPQIQQTENNIKDGFMPDGSPLQDIPNMVQNSGAPGVAPNSNVPQNGTQQAGAA